MLHTDCCPQIAVHRPPSTDRRPQTAVHRSPSTDRRPQTAVQRPPSKDRHPKTAIQRPPSKDCNPQRKLCRFFRLIRWNLVEPLTVASCGRLWLIQISKIRVRSQSTVQDQQNVLSPESEVGRPERTGE
uniref:Uncharacterized protein n=1 Tax=Knipowitschia caucasica TaxID=637954 RepID=A0AAV2LTS4_KNICA